MTAVRAAGLIVFRIVAKEIEYLVMQTSYGHHHWTPPKGHVDPGEDDMQTALRETEEEAGLKEHQLRILTGFRKELNYTVNNKPKVVVYWLAQLADSAGLVKLSHEHQDFKWLNLDEACRIVEYTDMQSVLKECDVYLKTKPDLFI